MKRSVRVVWVLLFGLSAFFASGAEVEFTLGREPRQEIKGWGFTPAPLDWDSRSMLRDAALLTRIYRNSGANMARILVGDINMYDASVLKIRTSAIDSFLLPQLEALHAAGIERYVISLSSAPVYTKVYSAPSAYVELDPNFLRPDCEDLVARFLADAVDRLREKKAILPVAVSIQSQPNCPVADYGCPPAAAHGTFYSPEQWRRVVEKTRAALDEKGLSEVGIIGPESFGIERRFFISADKTSASPRKTAVSGLSGFAFNLPDNFQADSDGGQSLGKLPSKGIWMLTPYFTRAVDDRALILETFLAMQRDLLALKVDHWFWRYGFTWERGAESLCYGRNGVETPVFVALKTLWHAAPAGSLVYELSRSPRSQTKCGAIAFQSPRGLAVVITNPENVNLTIQLKGVPQLSGTAHYFDGTAVRTAEVQRKGERFIIDAPKRAVVILALR